MAHTPKIRNINQFATASSDLNVSLFLQSPGPEKDSTLLRQFDSLRARQASADKRNWKEPHASVPTIHQLQAPAKRILRDTGPALQLRDDFSYRKRLRREFNRRDHQYAPMTIFLELCEHNEIATGRLIKINPFNITAIQINYQLAPIKAVKRYSTALSNQSRGVSTIAKVPCKCRKNLQTINYRLTSCQPTRCADPSSSPRNPENTVQAQRTQADLLSIRTFRFAYQKPKRPHPTPSMQLS